MQQPVAPSPHVMAPSPKGVLSGEHGSDGAWALAAGSAGSWLKKHLGLLRAQRYFSGSVFIALGVAVAFSGQGRK